MEIKLLREKHKVLLPPAFLVIDTGDIRRRDHFLRAADGVARICAIVTIRFATIVNVCNRAFLSFPQTSRLVASWLARLLRQPAQVCPLVLFYSGRCFFFFRKGAVANADEPSWLVRQPDKADRKVVSFSYKPQRPSI